MVQGSHGLAFCDALREVYGVEIVPSDLDGPPGLTDQQVILELLEKRGLRRKEIISRMEDCLEAMPRSFDRNIANDDTVVLDGVRELLERLKGKNVLMGLVTGNPEKIAWAKMKKTGLDGFFSVGGFGSDGALRSDLVRLAIKRAQKNLSFKYDRNVFLVGDTPSDVEAGKDAGAKTIAVATGSYSASDLKKAKPDLVLEDLRDTEKVLKMILD